MLECSQCSRSSRGRLHKGDRARTVIRAVDRGSSSPVGRPLSAGAPRLQPQRGAFSFWSISSHPFAADVAWQVAPPVNSNPGQALQQRVCGARLCQGLPQKWCNVRCNVLGHVTRLASLLMQPPMQERVGRGCCAEGCLKRETSDGTRPAARRRSGLKGRAQGRRLATPLRNAVAPPLAGCRT